MVGWVGFGVGGGGSKVLGAFCRGPLFVVVAVGQGWGLLCDGWHATPPNPRGCTHLLPSPPPHLQSAPQVSHLLLLTGAVAVMLVGFGAIAFGAMVGRLASFGGAVRGEGYWLVFFTHVLSKLAVE